MATRDPIRMPGEKDPDRSQRIAICAELLNDKRPETRIAAMFVDTAFGAPIVQTLRSMGFDNVYEVAFGGESTDIHCANLRAQMYSKLKDTLLLGALPAADENFGAAAMPAGLSHPDQGIEACDRVKARYLSPRREVAGRC